MSKNKNDKISSIDFNKIAASVGLMACSLASIAVIAEAFEGRHHKTATPAVAQYGHGSSHHEFKGAAEEMRKEEIRHMHVSYGVTMRSHPISGSI